MSMVRNAATLIAGLALAATALSGSAWAQANCDWYARTALKQQQENEQRKCGFKGPEWSADLKAHMTWCAGVAPDLWKQQAQKRDQALAQCAKK